MLKSYVSKIRSFMVRKQQIAETDPPEFIKEFDAYYSHSWASLVAQKVKNLHAMQETWVQSLGSDDILEKGMATHSSILAWRIPWTEEPGGLQSMGSQRVGHD